MARKYPKGYYVYIHRRKTDGKVFYVGKGVRYRAWDTNHDAARNPYWKNMRKKHGLLVEIYKDSMNEVCAFTLEKILIAKYRSLNQPLTNLTNGGDGFDGVDENYRIESLISATARRVKSSLGEEFRSTSEAERWLRDNGYPKATAKAVSMVALGKRSFAYGRSWTYGDDLPDHPKIIDAVEYAKTKTERKVTMSGAISFNSAQDAARYLRSTINPKADSSSIIKACKGKLKTAYGHTWNYADE